MSTTIHHGDCLDVLRAMPDNSVDAVVCDPPYGLSNTTPEKVTDTIVRWAQGDREYVPTGKGFMGASWDAFVPPVAVWDECLRVLKPGGHLVAFAGSRTQDLMGLAIRLAGFDIRENLAWIYGSGFPKSLDISKAIDKMGGDPLAFRRFAKAYAEAVKASKFTHTNIDRHLGIKSSSCYWAREDHRGGMPPRHHWEQVRDLMGLDSDFERLYDEAERAVIGQKAGTHSASGSGLGGTEVGNKQKRVDVDITAPATPEAEKWQGWGTATKPAHEPVILARKPFPGTVAANTLEWGTGGLNIDATRIETTDNLNGGGYSNTPSAGNFMLAGYGSIEDLREAAKTDEVTPDGRHRAKAVLARAESVKSRVGEFIQPTGRWPANVVLDPDTAQVLDSQAEETSRFFKVVEPDVPFMYAAKAPKRERPSYVAENGTTVQHSTVKPLSIMSWLVKLVTPEGGTVLDPFAGSGTTVEAALINGFNVIGIEREADYLPLIQQRIDRATGQLPVAS